VLAGEIAMDNGDLIKRLREVFHWRRYGPNAEYHPDFDLFDVSADMIERLQLEIERLREAGGK
jgi:hypothetical protein